MKNKSKRAGKKRHSLTKNGIKSKTTMESAVGKGAETAAELLLNEQMLEGGESLQEQGMAGQESVTASAGQVQEPALAVSEQDPKAALAVSGQDPKAALAVSEQDLKAASEVSGDSGELASEVSDNSQDAAAGEFMLQFCGKEVAVSSIPQKVREDYKKNAGEGQIASLNIYVKPEDNKVYYVVNEDYNGSTDLTASDQGQDAPSANGQSASCVPSQGQELLAGEFMLQFCGQEVAVLSIPQKVREDYNRSVANGQIHSLSIYVKPEDNKAYYVINGDYNGNVDLV